MRKVLLSLAVLALSVPAFAENKAVKIGDKAPTFSGIPAIAPNGEQTSLSLSDLKEDVVVLVFLANHCPAVQACDDRIIDFASDYKDKTVKLVAVCVNDMDSDRLPAIKKHMKEKSINYTYGYDESQAIGRAYGAVVTPHFFVLDKERNIRYIGAMDDNVFSEDKAKKQYLRDAVDALLAGKAPAVEETSPQGLRHQVQEQLSCIVHQPSVAGRALMRIGRAVRDDSCESRRTHRVRRLSVDSASSTRCRLILVLQRRGDRLMKTLLAWTSGCLPRRRTGSRVGSLPARRGRRPGISPRTIKLERSEVAASSRSGSPRTSRPSTRSSTPGPRPAARARRTSLTWSRCTRSTASKGLAVVSLSLDDPTDAKAVAAAEKFLKEKKAVITNVLLDEDYGDGFDKLDDHHHPGRLPLRARRQGSEAVHDG